MVHHQTSGTLIPRMGALHNPALGLNHKAWRRRFGPQLLLRVAPRASVAIGRVPDHLDVQAHVRCLQLQLALAGGYSGRS